MQTDTTITTDAMRHVQRFNRDLGLDGQCFEWLNPEAETDDWAASLDAAIQTHDPRHGTRYEWPDGSAIVVSGDAWDLGIHRDRLDAMTALIESLDYDSDFYRPTEAACPASFQWAYEQHPFLLNPSTWHEPCDLNS